MIPKSIAAATLLCLGGLVFTAVSQGPDDKDKKGPPPKKGWEPGKIVPPHVLDALDLSAEQMEQLRALEMEVRGKLLKLFTEEQKQRLKDIKGPDGPPSKKGKDKPPPPPKECGGGCRDQTRLQPTPVLNTRPQAA